MDHERVLSTLSLAQHSVRLQTLLDHRISGVLGSHGLSRSELDVLGALAERSDAGARPRELSSRLLLTTGGLSNILRRLQQDGLIDRQSDVKDARSRVIRLTPKGRATARETGKAANDAINRLLEAVDESVLRTAAQALHEVLHDIDEDSPVHRHIHPTISAPAEEELVVAPQTATRV